MEVEHICVTQTQFSLLMATTSQRWRYNFLFKYSIKCVIWVGELCVNERKLPLEFSPTDCLFLGNMCFYICLIGLFYIVIISSIQWLYSDLMSFIHMPYPCSNHLIDVYLAVLIVAKWSMSSLFELWVHNTCPTDERKLLHSLLFRWSGIFLTLYFNPVFSQSTEGLVQPNLKFVY